MHANREVIRKSANLLYYIVWCFGSVVNFVEWKWIQMRVAPIQTNWRKCSTPLLIEIVCLYLAQRHIRAQRYSFYSICRHPTHLSLVLLLFPSAFIKHPPPHASPPHLFIVFVWKPGYLHRIEQNQYNQQKCDRYVIVYRSMRSYKPVQYTWQSSNFKWMNATKKIETIELYQSKYYFEFERNNCILNHTAEGSLICRQKCGQSSWRMIYLLLWFGENSFLLKKRRKFGWN